MKNVGKNYNSNDILTCCLKLCKTMFMSILVVREGVIICDPRNPILPNSLTYFDFGDGKFIYVFVLIFL